MSAIESVKNAIMTNIEISSMLYNNNVTIVNQELISRYKGGVCMFKNSKGQCKAKQTYLIHSIGKCVCNLHMTYHQNKIHKIINFEKNFNKLLKKLFKNTNNREQYIETLKDIILLATNHKKHKYTLEQYFNLVDANIDNFELDDDEYNALVDHYKYS